MSKIRVGIVGCGGMAKGHANRLDKVKEVAEITAVADIDKSRAQAVAALLPGSPAIETDYRKILDKVDALLLVLPHHLHHPVTIECLEAGKHVLVEKPLANSEKDCIEMIQVANRTGKVLMVAYCMRFHPLVVKMKELIDSKTYGEIFQLSIWTEQYTEYPEGHWTRNAAMLGGGQFFSHGCHYIDLLLWMLGKPVRGMHIGTNKGTPWMEKEGTSNITIEFENGVLGYHFGTWGARGTRLKYSFHAHCTGGMLEIDFTKGQLILHGGLAGHVPDLQGDAQTEQVLLEIPHAKPTDLEMAHFIDCIRTGRKPLTDPVSSLEGLEVIWKLYEAEKNNTLADLRGTGLGTFNL